jgi:hypothetical protein
MRPPALSSGHFASCSTSAAASGSTLSRDSRSVSPTFSGRVLDQVGALVGGHLGDDLRDGVHAHRLDEVLLRLLVEALEDGRGVLGLEGLEELRGLLLVEQVDEVGDVLVVHLLEQRAELRGIFGEELADLGDDGDGDPHHGGGRNAHPRRIAKGQMRRGAGGGARRIRRGRLRRFHLRQGQIG